MRCTSCILVVGLLGVGCGGGSGPQKYRVTGTVQYKGTPLAGGSIDFIPEEGDRTGTVSTEVKAGKFEFPKANGVPAGKYKVSITAGFSGPPPNPSGEDKGGPRIVELPERYNSRTTLRAEVTPTGANVFSFDDLK